jgi:hypothetical protein
MEKAEKLPEILYKYIPWNNDRCRKMLFNNNIYFTSPSRFNDPFDCSLNIRLGESVKTLTLEVLLQDYYPKSSRSEIEKMAHTISGIASSILDETAFIQKNFAERIYLSVGVFSLSEINDNILMWSHYSNSHKGMCIGFKTLELRNFLKEHFDKNLVVLSKMEYSKEYPDINLDEKDEDIGRKLLKTKADNWRYEKEWRFILNGRTDKEVELPEGVLSEIILGCRMPRNHKIEIIEHLRDRKEKIELKEAYPNSREFKLDFHKINY